MDLSALGHTLKPLIRDGYVALVPDKKDRRVKHVTLTKAYRKKLEQTSKLWADAQGRFEKRLAISAQPIFVPSSKSYRPRISERHLLAVLNSGCASARPLHPRSRSSGFSVQKLLSAPTELNDSGAR